MHRLSTARLAALVLAATVALAPAAASAATWRPMRALRLLVDSKLDAAASIYVAEGGVLLVTPSSGDWSYLIWVKDGRAAAIKRSNVAMSGGAPALDPASVEGRPVSEFRKSGANVHLVHDDHSLWLTPRPPLVGEVVLEQILMQKPEYRKAADAYTPDPQAVGFLSSVSDSVELIAFFGSWCSVCNEEIPKLIRTVESARNGRITVRYFAVSEDLKEPREALKKHSVSATPSLLVYRNGVELGRIVEHPQKTIEADIAAILKRARG